MLPLLFYYTPICFSPFLLGGYLAGCSEQRHMAFFLLENKLVSRKTEDRDEEAERQML